MRDHHPSDDIDDLAGRGSVWLTGQVCSRDQRKGRYLPGSNAHPGKMLPSIARYLIATYTSPGEQVLDPMAGIGTTVVEAAHLDRAGVGVEYEPRWARLAQANIDYAHTHGATGAGHIVRGDARHLPDVLPEPLRDHLHGQVGLVVTSPPYGLSTHGNPREYAGAYGRILQTDHVYGWDRRNLAYADPDQLVEGLTRVFAGCLPLLAPAARVAVTARPYRRRGELVDIPGMITAAARAAGLTLHERCIALLAGVRGGRLIPRASLFQLGHIRAAHRRGDPQWLLQHETCLIFTTGGGT